MNDADLIALRISLARIAQTLGVDNNLHVADKNYSALLTIAQHHDRGWNNLAALIQGRCVELIQEQSK